MKLYPECLPCFLKRILYEIKLVNNDDKIAIEILKACSVILGQKTSPSSNSAIISTLVHKRTYDLLGNDDPYSEMKKKSNEVAIKLLPQAEQFIARSNDRLRAAIITAIVGNIFDYGITEFKDPKSLFKLFKKMCAEGLGHDDVSKIKKILNRSKRILYFTDNCGEIVFDKLVLREIKRLYPEMHITLVPKSTAILSDATIDDVYRFGIDKFADEVVGTERFAVGVDLENMSSKFRRMLKKADLIICKGMANYESFSDYGYKPIAYLMRIKCEPVAFSINTRKDINVAKLYI